MAVEPHRRVVASSRRPGRRLRVGWPRFSSAMARASSSRALGHLRDIARPGASVEQDSQASRGHCRRSCHEQASRRAAPPLGRTGGVPGEAPSEILEQRHEIAIANLAMIGEGGMKAAVSDRAGPKIEAGRDELARRLPRQSGSAITSGFMSRLRPPSSLKKADIHNPVKALPGAISISLSLRRGPCSAA